MAVQLGDLVLAGVTEIVASETLDAVRIPVLGGPDVVQAVGRSGLTFVLRGSLTVDQAETTLRLLRRDVVEGTQRLLVISSLTDVFSAPVLLTRLTVTQRAGAVADSDYCCELAEQSAAAPGAGGAAGDVLASAEQLGSAVEEGRQLAGSIAAAALAAGAVGSLWSPNFETLADPDGRFKNAGEAPS